MRIVQGALPLLLLSACALLSLAAAVASAGTACPPPETGIAYNFSALADQKSWVDDGLGHRTLLWLGMSCEASVNCAYDGHEFAACKSWQDPDTGAARWAALGHAAGSSWQYIHPQQPSLGVRRRLGAGVDNYGGCTGNTTHTTILYQCLAYPGDDSMELMQAGTAPECEWLFRFNSAAVCRFALPPSGKRIVPGANWTATDGTSIQAHAPGIVIDPTDASYWWFGESEKTADLAQHGVNCYHSSDLVSWVNHGMVIRQSDVSVPGRSGPFTIERPKVLYNAQSGSYVMWFHIDDERYSVRRVGIAVSFTPAGPFRFVKSFQPDGLPSLDMSLYEDRINGTVHGAYFVRSVDNSYVGISALSADYLSTTGLVSIIPEAREGHAIFHYGSRYYMLTSHLTGWAPNAMEAFVSNHDTLLAAEWTSIGNPTNSDISYNSQPALVLSHTANDSSEYFIYLGDRWMPDLLNASYIWLPIHINADSSLTISWKDSWDLDHPFNDSEREKQDRAVQSD